MNEVITLTSATGFHAAAKRPPAGLLLHVQLRRDWASILVPLINSYFS